MLGVVKERIVGSTRSVFSHGAHPLEHTLDHPGDPGVLGPESVSWRVIGDRASDPAMAAWVHNVLTDSFLVAYRTYGPEPLTDEDADRFVEEQTRIGALLGAAPLPTTAAELSTWVNDHPALASSTAQKNAIGFLRLPPLPVAVQLGYQPLLQAAIATIPPRLRTIIGVTPTPGATCIGTAAVGGLRWALGSSPARDLARSRALATKPPREVVSSRT